MPDGAATANLYCPKLITVLREGYGAAAFRRDVLAALTVAIVALPLSMAFAIASGVTPERGLYTTIVGGFLVSLLSGSRFQVGGPAGAFIVLVAATFAKYGLDDLLLTVLMSGVMLTALGLSRLGSLIRHIPHAVTVGFTSGIAIIILASQLRDLGGLHLAGAEPGPLLPKLTALAQALPTLNSVSLVVGIGSAVLIFAQRRWQPTWPGMLTAVILASVAAWALHLPVETIGSRFGELPQGLPRPMVPKITIDLILQLLPAALSFTLLGGVESLLSAKVADGMTGRKHRSNMELVAQGIANIGSAFFGGIAVTGTIARTATNIRAGAVSPLSGMMHALFVLLFMLVAARLASFVPLSALSGVLVVVCWYMADKAEFAKLMSRWPSASVLITTFGLTILRDLTTGIIAGCLLAALLAALRHRVSEEGAYERPKPL
jgi:sulfate permease, SulP family